MAYLRDPNSLKVLQNMAATAPDRRPDYTPNIGRNQARVEALLKSLGTADPTLADGSVSQSDIESAYQQKEAEDTQTANEDAARKIALAKAPEEVRAQSLKDTVGIPAEITGRYNVAATEAASAGRLKEDEAKRAGTLKLLETFNNGQGGQDPDEASGGVRTTFKPAINANGEVSFAPVQTPALVQRALNQLLDARDKTMTALSEAERMYPGINDEALKADATPAHPSGVMSGVKDLFKYATGMGTQKYGSAADQAGAGIERLKYTMGVPTPFAKLAQEASFGNIEQMAGQLPGVRGLATITPLFREHQSRWGHEAPLASVQRLRHMADIMDQTIKTVDTSGGGR